MLDIYLVEANSHQFADSDTCVKTRFDQYHISKVATVSDRLVEAAHVLLCGDR